MSGRARLPSDELRNASQRRTRRWASAPTLIDPTWRPGDKVHWRGYTGARALGGSAGDWLAIELPELVLARSDKAGTPNLIKNQFEF